MRTRIFTKILSSFLVLLLLGLFYTQIIRYERYRVMSEENRLKVVPFMAPRGRILDRNGNILAQDVLSFNASLIYSRIKDKNRIKNILMSVLEIPEKDIPKLMKRCQERPYLSVSVSEDIGIEKAAHIEEISMNCPGLLLEVSSKREYVNKKIASNMLGYLGFLSRPELDKLKSYGYKVYDWVGRGGIEKSYDAYLRGKHGGKQVEVNYRGQEVMTLGLKEPIPGKDIYLTIDLELQKFCDKLLEARRGAIIIMDPNTGAIFAMASSPAYDPNLFTSRTIRPDKIRNILKDKSYPLLNRAISGAYPPGSVFKVVTATCALENHAVSQNTTFNCPGYFKLGRATFKCWRPEGHGLQGLQEAIKHSCNVYFYNTGLKIGPEKLSDYAKGFGFGSLTGIDLPGESTGFLPTADWQKNILNRKWYNGDTVNYSIGQGYLLCTPIQVACMMSAFANEGFLVRPHLIEKLGNVPEVIGGKIDLNISQESLRTIREALRDVVNDPRGTGIKARQEDIIISGKTGTAQAGENKSHGWFAGFAPFKKARLVTIVFDEYGGRGGYFAAEIGGKIFHKAKELGLL